MNEMKMRWPARMEHYGLNGAKPMFRPGSSLDPRSSLKEAPQGWYFRYLADKPPVPLCQNGRTFVPVGRGQRPYRSGPQNALSNDVRRRQIHDAVFDGPECQILPHAQGLDL